METGKPAGIACVQLDESNLCRLFGQAQRPQVCMGFSAQSQWCGSSREEAMQRLTTLEQETA